MAAKAATKTAPRTVTRDEPAARMAPPIRVTEDRAPVRDPNVIYTRDGRPIDMQRVISQNDDRFNLERLGVVAPQGWTYEWRTTKIKGAEATRQIVDDAQRGWTPVPSSRHPGKVMPANHNGPIETDGLMLMERPQQVTAISRAAERKAANDQLNISRSMTGLMQRANPNVDMLFDQSDMSAQRGTGVKIERIPMGTPDKNYTYTLDE